MAGSRTQSKRMCKSGGSPSSYGSYLSRGPSEVKCIKKSETPGLLYTDANKVEKSFLIGSEWSLLLLKTTGTDNSKNALYTYYCDSPNSLGVQSLVLLGAVMSVAITDLYCLFISFNQDILKITADNFIYKVMISLNDLILSQQKEKSFLCYFSPS